MARFLLHRNIKLTMQLAACRLLTSMLPIRDKAFDDRRTGERRGVAKIGDIALGDLAQASPHDLYRPGLGQPWRKLDDVGRSDRPDSGDWIRSVEEGGGPEME